MTQRIVVVVFDGVPLGIMSFAFGVFDIAVYYGVLAPLIKDKFTAVVPRASSVA